MPPALREFDLSGAKPILPRGRKRELSSKEAFRLEEEFGPRLPSHHALLRHATFTCEALETGLVGWAYPGLEPANPAAGYRIGFA